MKHRFLLFIVVFFITTICAAQDMAVPANVQVMLIKKIINFDMTLKEKSQITVVVFYNDGTENIKDDIVMFFQKAGFKVSASRTDQGLEGLSETSIAYLAAGSGIVKEACAKNKVLSFSGVRSVISSGMNSIGLGVEEGKPKIEINMAQFKAEGHQFSSDFLQIARINQ